MAPVVRIDEETKTKLEELQAEIQAETGIQVMRKELLAQLVMSAADSRSELVDSFRDGTEMLTDDELAQFDEGRISSGVETEEDEIDDILYE
jgi:DNA-directed RNA polymerase specialized sigma subunit